ncbi:MAG: mercuric reductase [Spirochaeta sp.]|nr:mercuric reductase [Spirochaeta sp.]
MKSYDVILVGTGQATGSIVPELLEMGRSLAIVEADRVGGTCVNWGCTPTKTMVASARAAHMARRGPDFGVTSSGLSVDFGKVMQRVNDMRFPSSDGFKAWLEDISDFYSGWAEFVDEHTIRVGEHEIRGEQIVIHTGATAVKPPIEGIDSVPWLDNKGILALEELPEHLLVLGGSYIGLEFAQAFRRLGSRVTVLEYGDRLIGREDPDVSKVAHELLEAEGIAFQLQAEALKLSGSEGNITLDYRQNGEVSQLHGSHILVGVGRRPNTKRLNLPAAGVKTNERGYIEVDDVGRSSTPHIFALGDVNGRGAFTHTSVHDGQVFIDHLKGGNCTISNRTLIYSMFIDPPLARVGMSTAQARDSGRNVLEATRQMSAINRAREKDETQGFIRLLVDGDTKKLLGATVFGVGGDEIIGMLALAIQAELPYTVLQETVLPHPTVSELLPWIFDDLSPLE